MPKIYSASGEELPGHVVVGSVVLDDANLVTLEGDAAFSSADSYVVLLDESVMSTVTKRSGSQFRVNGGRNNRKVRFVVVGW